MSSNDTGTQTEESEPDYKKLYEATQADLENVSIINYYCFSDVLFSYYFNMKKLYKKLRKLK